MTPHVIRLFAVLLCALAAPQAAHAHPVVQGVGGFFGGLLHPLLVPTHLLAVIALGLLIGQQAPRWGRASPAVYVVAVVVGLGVIALGAVPRFAGEALLALAILMGLLTALARPLPESAGCVLAAAAGFALALDSPPGVISVREANIMLIGTGFGASVILIAVVEGASRLVRDWQRIGARIVGAWIAASAILVLALGLPK